MEKKRTDPPNKTEWIDPDDAPELTEEWFRKADVYVGEKLVRRGEGATGDETKKRVPRMKKS